MRIDLSNGITLQTLERRHSEDIFNLVDQNRGHLRQWLPWVDSTRTQKDSLAFIEMTIKQFLENKSLQFGVWRDGALAGMIGQHQVDWANKRASLGYWLDKEQAGKGIMAKSCKALVDYSFKEQKLNCVEIAAAVDNKKSRAIPERLGFKLDGILRQKEWLYYHFVDHAVYSLLKSEWSV